ncbi:Chimeric ERCC6-PGBD3 protein [Araneus ventricosus]|uniref:Chimeric ERCC6-PGBD3 protein n=1 Tax=Araneus ventricosus TaxID=182803 RepID=A0A4Y2IWG9_ARAVE|nr:Chimeric ERCC6-PGBD3 protein [Araneus ventricosus]
MEHITYIDRGKRKVMTVDEFMALDVSSDSDDGLDFDDFSDEDPTVNPKDLESSDSDSESETTVKKVKNSSSIIEKQVHPSIAEAGQPTSSNTSQPTASNINQPTSSNKKTDTRKCQILWKKQNETNLYSTQKNPNKPVDCTVYDIHKFIGICILSSLAPPTCVRDLWNDVYGIDLVKETMSQTHFEKLHSSLHFNDNAKTPDHQSPDHDKLYKIRPILDYLNQRCLSVPMSERLSIDEQMRATKARHHMKIYMKDKPHKWGYKLYVLCGDMGFAHKFEIYSGQENDPKFRRDGEPDIGASGNVVIRLSREIPRNQNYKLYFDRYYSSLNLSVYLFQQGIQCVGTIQRNRIPNCKFRNDQELKKEPRGFSEEFSTNFESVDISTVLYKDNSNVAFLSTFVGEVPKSEVRRFDRKKKQHIMVPCPAVVSVYNSHMGNVDLLDSNIGRHHIKVRSKRWYMRLFFHLVDTIVINAWILYRRMLKETDRTDPSMTQKMFRTILAETLCRVGPELKRRGRPSTSDPIKTKRIKHKGSSLPTREIRSPQSLADLECEENNMQTSQL